MSKIDKIRQLAKEYGISRNDIVIAIRKDYHELLRSNNAYQSKMILTGRYGYSYQAIRGIVESR